jgi:hypothetical protein
MEFITGTWILNFWMTKDKREVGIFRRDRFKLGNPDPFLKLPPIYPTLKFLKVDVYALRGWKLLK